MYFTFSKNTTTTQSPPVTYTQLTLKNIQQSQMRSNRNTRSISISRRPLLGNLYSNMYDLHGQIQSCSSCGK